MRTLARAARAGSVGPVASQHQAAPPRAEGPSGPYSLARRPCPARGPAGLPAAPRQSFWPAHRSRARAGPCDPTGRRARIPAAAERRQDAPARPCLAVPESACAPKAGGISRIAPARATPAAPARRMPHAGPCPARGIDAGSRPARLGAHCQVQPQLDHDRAAACMPDLLCVSASAAFEPNLPAKLDSPPRSDAFACREREKCKTLRLPRQRHTCGTSAGHGRHAARRRGRGVRRGRARRLPSGHLAAGRHGSDRRSAQEDRRIAQVRAG